MSRHADAEPFKENSPPCSVVHMCEFFDNSYIYTYLPYTYIQCIPKIAPLFQIILCL